MITMAITTAVIITGSWSDIPTAVTTLSMENTMSSTMIWPTTAPKVAALVTGASSSSPSMVLWISWVPLAKRNTPPASRITSRQDTTWSMKGMVKMGAVRPMIQAMEASRTTRMPSAAVRPNLRAFSCCAAGNLAAITEMNTRLSMPRTISSAVRVNRLSQRFGSAKSMGVSFGNGVDQRIRKRRGGSGSGRSGTAAPAWRGERPLH